MKWRLSVRAAGVILLLLPSTGTRMAARQPQGSGTTAYIVVRLDGLGGTSGGANSAVSWPVKNDRGEIVGISETADLDPLGVCRRAPRGQAHPSPGRPRQLVVCNI